MAKNGINVNSIIKNPAFIGALVGGITWYLLDEVFNKDIKRILRGKKVKKVRRKGKKVIRNHMGFIEPVEVYEIDVDTDNNNNIGLYATDVDIQELRERLREARDPDEIEDLRRQLEESEFEERSQRLGDTEGGCIWC